MIDSPDNTIGPEHSETIVPTPRESRNAKERPVVQAQLQGFLAKQGHPLPESVQEELAAFCTEEREYGREEARRLDPVQDRAKIKLLQMASYNHSQNWANFRDQLGMTPGLDPRFFADEGLLFIARNPDSQKIIGFSAAVLNSSEGVAPTVASDYVGITSRDAYQGYGLGKRLVLLRDLALSNMGISRYTSHVWEQSLHMYETSGLTLADIARTPKPHNPTSEYIAVTVQLDPAQVRETCQKAGIDPTVDPPATQQNLSLK